MSKVLFIAFFDYSPQIMSHNFVYPVGNRLIRGALRLFSRYEIEGSQSVPLTGPLIVVSNHLSNVDPSLLGVSIPRLLHFLAKRELFRGPLSTFILEGYGAFPIDRGGRDFGGFRKLIRLLKQGEAVAIFPEGTRSPQGLRQAMDGVAMLHVRSGAPLLPVGITGTENLGPIWRIFVPTGTIKVRIGEPFSLPLSKGRPERSELTALSHLIMQRVAKLLPASYRGFYL